MIGKGRNNRIPGISYFFSIHQAVQIGHRNTAEHGADDSQESLVGAADKRFLMPVRPSRAFLSGSIHRSLKMTGITG